MRIENTIAREINEAETIHIREDRQRRLLAVNTLMNEENGTFVRTFWVDKGHKNGPELHNIYSNGVIKIYNERTKAHITDLIARVGQIYRYYEAVGEKPPKYIIAKAREHQNKGLNYI